MLNFLNGIIGHCTEGRNLLQQRFIYHLSFYKTANSYDNVFLGWTQLQSRHSKFEHLAFAGSHFRTSLLERQCVRKYDTLKISKPICSTSNSKYFSIALAFRQARCFNFFLCKQESYRSNPFYCDFNHCWISRF